MSRTRVSSSIQAQGTKVLISTSSSVPATFTGHNFSCTDDTGYGVDHALNITKVNKLTIGRMNGTNDYPYGHNLHRSFTNYAPELLASVNPGAGTFPGLPSVGGAVTTAMARSNPSRAVIQPFTALIELRDFPKLYRQIGNLIRAGVRNPVVSGATGNLTWQFGIRPLINDLVKLSNFQGEVEKKLRQMEKLQRKGGMRSKVKVYEETLTSTSTVTLQSVGVTLNGLRNRTQTCKRWVTIRWVPTQALPTSSSERYAMARNAVLGLSAGGLMSQAWEAIPWSWLIDWFTNIGDFISTYSSSIPAVATRVNVMTTYTTMESYYPINAPAWLVVGPSHLRWEQKLRSQSGATLDASLPFLSANQWSILGSLAIVRSRPARG